MKTSVCMAVYNGQKYLEKQLFSILEQLDSDDEVIIVNDYSTDNSLDIIDSFSDLRIKLISNSSNLGVIRSFEKALNNTTGDIIFFSDQDDIWLPGKVKTVTDCMKQSQCCAVVSDALVIDKDETIIHDSYFVIRKIVGPGVWKSFYRNNYIGCCMAICSSIKPLVLPFPDFIPMHDIWIGIVCDFLGEVKFIHKPLIAYRRHGYNQTPLSGNDWGKIIKKRFVLLILIFTKLPPLWLKKTSFLKSSH
jgi:glycosyltransferase involved in cell wall biosynthesis